MYVYNDNCRFVGWLLLSYPNHIVNTKKYPTSNGFRSTVTSAQRPARAVVRILSYRICVCLTQHAMYLIRSMCMRSLLL